jgi:hypothetical protein
MPRIKLRSRSLSRVELDQRSREARLRLEWIERLLVPRAAVRQSQLRRVLYLFRVGIWRGAPQESRASGPLSVLRRALERLAHAPTACPQSCECI